MQKQNNQLQVVWFLNLQQIYDGKSNTLLIVYSVKYKTLLELIKNQFNQSYNELYKKQTSEQMITKNVI